MPDAGASMLDAHVIKHRPAFDVDVTLRIEENDSVAIFGPSGAGKSTLLSCIAGIDQPDAGAIVFTGVRLFPSFVPTHERGIGYVTQRSLLFPHLRVDENVCFGTRADPDWIAELRCSFELDEVWRASARSISGGQAQRVALARMFARRPALVLLDEPFAGLDRAVVRDLLAALARWQRLHASAMIVVDHQENVLRKLCPRVCVMERGKIVQEGAWDTVTAQPCSPQLASLLAPL
ncbi:MAG: ATP-binding cassette domain-containing protein [Candidatus Eremiobacteraeota bacterium]|nr:ATP-binding cassette domain-containing protein [Candidatus Eremiobacteraeota bacterium]